jgi:hypothetical protein
MNQDAGQQLAAGAAFAWQWVLTIFNSLPIEVIGFLLIALVAVAIINFFGWGGRRY